MGDAVDDSPLEFPCRFPIKIMGRNSEPFRQAAIALVEQHAGTVPEDSITMAPSRKGNFLSITVTITAEDRDQLDRIYRALTDHEEILVAL